MKTTIQVANHEFARHLLDTRFAQHAILINDPGDEHASIRTMRGHAKSHVYLEFYDLDFESETHRYPMVGDVERAIDYYSDLNRRGGGDLVVACVAGISRSAAMAFVVACSDRSPEAASGVWNPRVHYPNRLIVRLGAELLGKPGMVDVAEEFWRDREARRALKGKTPRAE